MSSFVDLKILKVIGVITIFYWLTFMVYLPPITPYPDLDPLIDEALSVKAALGASYPAKIDLPKEDLKRE